MISSMRGIAKCLGGLVAIGTVYFVATTLADLWEVRSMTDDRKSVCVGRILIDVPNTFKVRYRGALVSGFQIQSVEESTPQFLANLEKKELELKQRTNERGQPSLEINQEVKNDYLSGKIFRYDREWVHGFEGEKRVDSTFAKSFAYVHGNGLSFIFTSEVGGDRLPELARIVKQLRPRKRDEIPMDVGFCIDRGIFNNQVLANHTESVVAFFTSPQHPDFGIALDYAAGRRPSPTLFDRVDSADFDFGFRKLTLRRKERAVNGFAGQELAEKFLEFNGVTRHIINWESVPDPAVTNPIEMSFELTTGISPRPGGKPVDASLADLALLELWDSMVSSIRPRPTSVQKP